MKKLFNSRFLFILIASLIGLILLGVGAYFLFDESDATFVKDGYVLNPLSPNVEKYYFDENTSYRENLSSMVEFTDTDKNDVSILRDSFLHYSDGSLSFLSNGAILDLDSIDGSKVVKFYNITSKSVIFKNKDGYVIENLGNNININNFIGRISDTKYIIVGNLSAKISGNDTDIKGDYFEIVYVEEGIVNIENNNVKYQVAADGTYIYAGNRVIDLGNKKITIDGEDVMSLTSITINGNENIEIMPLTPSEEGNGEGDGTGDGDGNGQGDGQGNGEGDNNGEGTGGGTGGEIGHEEVKHTKDIVVTLKDAKIGSTSVSVVFDMYNNTEDDSFMMTVTNLDTGKTVDIINSVVALEKVNVNLLSPGTRYLFTVINNRDNNKYFQKIFETSEFGIKLEKSYATDSELGFKITIDENTDVSNAKLALYRFNEETKQNEIVTTSYYDSETGENKSVQKVTYLKSFGGDISGTHEIVYDGLDSNTIYTAVLDEFSFESANFKDVYNITLTALTLKKTPTFNEMIADKDVGKGSFKLSLGNISDKDNAILNYTYLIYENSNPTETVIEPISKGNASPIEIKVGDGDNELRNDTNYFYRVIIEYFDNEKYIEYITSDTINFVMGSDPYITVVPDTDKISYDRIAATIYLIDNSCLVSMPGREKCNGESSAVIDVSKVNAITGEKVFVYSKAVSFEVVDNDVKYDLYLDKLQAGTTYSIDVRAVLNTNSNGDRTIIEHTSESKKNITTKSLSSFTTDWVDVGSSANHVVNVNTKFVAEEATGTMTPEETAASIKKVTFKLYEGNNIEDLPNQIPIATRTIANSEEFNIKENFYDNDYRVSTDETFGLDIDSLKALNNEGKLSEYYTVVVQAYYDTSLTNEVRLNNNVTSYAINPILLMSNIEEPVINIENITNGIGSNRIQDKLSNSDTHVGYFVHAAFDIDNLLLNGLTPNSINLYVYNKEQKQVKFYIKDKNDNFVLVDTVQESLGNNGFWDSKIYMDYGSEYLNKDEIMSRGNVYYIGYVINLTSSKGNLSYPNNLNHDVNNSYGVYSRVLSEKESPSISMYISSSTKNSITYNYSIFDPDNAIYRESLEDDYGFYYTIGEGEESKISLIKTDDNKFEGNLTLTGLSNHDVYSLYYKKNITKTDNLSEDVYNYMDGEDSEGRIFDGFYDVDSGNYNFKYEIINNQAADNKVTIKVLADDEILDRIINYKVNFSATLYEKDRNGNYTNNTIDASIDKEFWELSSCNNDSEEDSIYRCISVDYTELKKEDEDGNILWNMKSDDIKTNNITVTVTAMYDNGLTGFDFIVGENNEGYQYPYMILQNNNTATELGKYISYTKSGQIIQWQDHLEIPKGYYTYKIVGTQLYYYGSGYDKNFRINLGPNGYYNGGYGTINPKMISVANMTTTNNKFSFGSIIPKIAVKEKTQLLNGAVEGLTLSGADFSDFKNEGSKNDPKYYLYVETWDNVDSFGKSNETVRPTLKVLLDGKKTVDAIIDGLAYNSTYYFGVYAYLYDSYQKDYVYTRLFDDGYKNKYEVKDYSFNSFDATGVYINKVSTLNVDKDVYGKRYLDTTIYLSSYKSEYPFNFGIEYVLCTDFECDNESGYIYKGSIPISDVTSEVKLSFSLSEEDLIQYFKDNNMFDEDYYDNFVLEYDKNYYLRVYGVTNLYEKDDSNFIESDQTVFLSVFDSAFLLRKLNEPSFTVERRALITNDSKYAIDLIITIDDKDKTFVGKAVDGKAALQSDKGLYYVELLDSNLNIAGTLQVLGDGNVYTDALYNGDDYSSYGFDASTVSKHIRITDLNENEKYTIKVYSNTYLNNSTIENIEDRTYEVFRSHTVFSANEYGIAFGNQLIYSATEKSIIATFPGGSSFDNVVEVNYTVGLWDEDESTTNTRSGTFIIGEDGKEFEMYKETGDWRFIIDPEGMINTLGQIYDVALSFKVKTLVPDTTDEYIYQVLDSTMYPSFAGRVQYVKDEEKK